MGWTLVQFLGIFWLLMAKACPSKQVAEDSQWISRPQEDDQGGSSEPATEEFNPEGFREGGALKTKLPQDIQDLTDLLQAVVGPHNEEYFDPQFDQVSPRNGTRVLGTNGSQSANLVDLRDKRMVAGLVSGFIPALTKFGGGMLKGILSQLIYRSDDPVYKQKLISKFVPRVLSRTSLGNSQTEQLINQQLQSRNYQSVLQTLQSVEQGLDERSFVPEQFKLAFNQNEHSPQLVQVTRKVFHSLVQTMDTLMTQRLSTSGNLIASLLTTLIENLRKELEEFDQTHSREIKQLLALNEQIRVGLKDCGPPNNTGIFACLAALLVCVSLIFPSLLILRNSLTAFNRKLQSTQQASIMRKAQRENYARAILMGNTMDRDTSPILPRRATEEPNTPLHWPDSNLQIRPRPVVNRGEQVQSARQVSYNEGYLLDSMPGTLADTFITSSRTTQAPEPKSRRTLSPSFEDSL